VRRIYKRSSASQVKISRDLENDISIPGCKSLNKVTFSRPIMSNKVIADRLEKERMRINKETVKYNIIDAKIDFIWIFHLKFVI